MNDIVKVFESETAIISAEEGCVVLRAPSEAEDRLVLTRGQALLLAEMARQFSAVFTAHLRIAADACISMNLSVNDGD